MSDLLVAAAWTRFPLGRELLGLGDGARECLQTDHDPHLGVARLARRTRRERERVRAIERGEAHQKQLLLARRKRAGKVRIGVLLRKRAHFLDHARIDRCRIEKHETPARLRTTAVAEGCVSPTWYNSSSGLP